MAQTYGTIATCFIEDSKHILPLQLALKRILTVISLDGAYFDLEFLKEAYRLHIAMRRSGMNP